MFENIKDKYIVGLGGGGGGLPPGVKIYLFYAVKG